MYTAKTKCNSFLLLLCSGATSFGVDRGKQPRFAPYPPPIPAPSQVGDGDSDGDGDGNSVGDSDGDDDSDGGFDRLSSFSRAKQT